MIKEICFYALVIIIDLPLMAGVLAAVCFIGLDIENYFTMIYNEEEDATPFRTQLQALLQTVLFVSVDIFLICTYSMLAWDIYCYIKGVFDKYFKNKLKFQEYSV